MSNKRPSIAEFGSLSDLFDQEEEFSQWIANRLNTTLGDQASRSPLDFPLKRTGTEVEVSGRYADIVAEVPWTDVNVVIENQLGVADYDHWGRLQMYGTHLDTSVRIYIAEEFPSNLEETILDANKRSDEVRYAAFEANVLQESVFLSPVVVPYDLEEIVDPPSEHEREVARGLRDIDEAYEQADLPGLTVKDGYLQRNGAKNHAVFGTAEPDNSSEWIYHSIATNYRRMEDINGNTMPRYQVRFVLLSDRPDKDLKEVQESLDIPNRIPAKEWHPELRDDRFRITVGKEVTPSDDDWDETVDWTLEVARSYRELYPEVDEIRTTIS
jgi:hypothetical protein